MSADYNKAQLANIATTDLIAELRDRLGFALPQIEQRPDPEWLTPDEAATVAKIPVKRLYEWARGKKWADRPSRRTLRIEAHAFKAWLGGKR